MKILNHHEIIDRITRIAVEIEERNLNEEKVFIAGINNNGWTLANLIFQELKQRDSNVQYELFKIKINPAAPLDDKLHFDIDTEKLKDQNLIIIDDVANTGRTLFYAFGPLMNVLLKRVDIAVLVDRKHKTFPIQVDYMGISLATTLLENIRVYFDEGNYSAILIQ
ncbi:MAG: phosphoribosyltransferase [Saprospiraceae bacterium]|nr:phosphoribosyltransferase [Saprospiraceae bacterium]